MLAGYLPFDDDPANPEGDNINLLYKYIVNTPLTFPEYVTPHARDLLRRILVPNPRKRADLFEVARHSWLSDYAHVVELITSSTTTPSEIQNTTVPAEDEGENTMLARSASVRESSKKAAASPAIGGLTSKQGTIDPDAEAAAHIRQQKDAKRRTVQVEYVAPTTQTQRGEPSGSHARGGKTRARSGSQGPVEVSEPGPASPRDKPLPRDPPLSKEAYSKAAAIGSRRPPSAHHNAINREGGRMPSENAYMASVAGTTGGRPPTGGSMKSTGSKVLGAGGRASYGQPLPPEIAGTNVHGRIQQPSKGSVGSYNISSPIPQDQQDLDYGRPSISVPSKFARVSGFAGEGGEPKGHKRSNTLGEISGKIFGRSGSIFGGKNRKRSSQQPTAGEKGKKYPPVSMNNSFVGPDESRQSMDSKQSRRSFSMGLGKKRSGSISGSQTSQERRHSRRFSLIPPGFSLKAIGIGKDHGPGHVDDFHQDLPIHDPARVDQYGRYVDQEISPDNQVEANTLDGMYAQLQDPVPAEYQPAPQHRFAPQQHGNYQQHGSPQQHERLPPASHGYMPEAVLNTGSESSIDNVRRAPTSAPRPQQYPQQEEGHDGRRVANASRLNKGVLQKNRRFVDAWDTDESSSRPHDHSGSSGPARKVMDFFRRRGKARGGEDR